MESMPGGWAPYLAQVLGYNPGDRALRRAEERISLFRSRFVPGNAGLKDLDPGCPFDPSHPSLFPLDPGTPPSMVTGAVSRQGSLPRPLGEDPVTWTMAQLHEALRSGALGLREVSRIYLDRLEEMEPRLGAMAYLALEEAENQIRGLERCSAPRSCPGLLAAVPIGIKDLFDIRGMPTTAGSPLYRHRVARSDSAVVARLRSEGALFPGLTITHELAWGATGENPHLGTPKNPWDPHRMPGGSSSGSGSGVSAAIFPAALGTDTGGSVRMPASLTGILGLKPTYGLLSRKGLMLFSPSLDHPGPMARHLPDLARLLTILTSPDPEDPTRLPLKGRDYEGLLESCPENLEGLSLGLVENWMTQVDPGVRERVESAARILEDLGAHIIPVDLPPAQDMLAANLLISYPEGAAIHLEAFRKNPEAVGKDVRQGLEEALGITPGEYLAGLAMRKTLCQQVDRAMGPCHALILPTTPVTAPLLGQKEVTWPDGVKEEITDALGRLTAPFNVTGQPALSVPAGLSQGLPVGLQLVGRPLREDILLWVAQVYLEAANWDPSPPTLNWN